MSLMGSVFFAIIDFALIILIILVINYIGLLCDYKNAKNELDRLELENSRLKSQIKTLRGDRVVFDPFEYFRNSRSKELDDDIKEAVKYARDKSHPDNGGSDGDFIKFYKLYQRICK